MRSAAANGEAFIITHAGKPIVKVGPIDAPETGTKRRLGFLSSQVSAPKDFDRLDTAKINSLFGTRK